MKTEKVDYKFKSAEDVAKEIADTFKLSYKTQVNIEGAVMNMHLEGLDFEKCFDIATDIVENVLLFEK